MSLIVAAFALATTAVAQNTAPAADYSKERLLLLVHNAELEKPKIERSVQFGFGYVDFKALGQRFRFNYLPLGIPLSGSEPWRSNDAWGSTPNPFELTGTTIPYTARTWNDRRAMNVELKRIEATERAKIKVKVSSSSSNQ
jgi:hypothetical protein